MELVEWEMQSRFIQPETVVLGLRARSPEDAIRRLADVLRDAGYVAAEYADAVLEREKHSPTGLAVGGTGVAIPHADSGFVLRTGIAVGLLDEPVLFGEMGGLSGRVPVEVVMMLAIHDPGESVPMLQSLVTMLQDGSTLPGVLRAKQSSEVVELMSAKLDESSHRSPATPFGQ